MGKGIDKRKFQAQEIACGIKSQHIWENENPSLQFLSLIAVGSYEAVIMA